MSCAECRDNPVVLGMCVDHAVEEAKAKMRAASQGMDSPKEDIKVIQAMQDALFHLAPLEV